MCGIAGILTQRPPGNQSDILRRMTTAIAHRGPDDSGFYETRDASGHWYLGLGHRRLSIIDLDTGHQPMASPDQTIQLVYNGEIYNFQALREKLKALGFQFTTLSDTEVLLHAYQAWGEQCVEYLEGMFAFALWDSTRQILLLARDRFGKKPLFLYSTADTLLFGSEIKALLEWPDLNRQIDQSAILDYLRFRYVPGPKTLLKDIRKLPPGHIAVWKEGTLTQRRYYNPPDHQLPVSHTPIDDPVGRFQEILDHAVRIRMISDVPYGAFLSGGLDSSTIVALMAQHSSQPVKTFSIGFTESEYSELGYARQVADAFQTEHFELEVSQDHLIEHLPSLVRSRDAPVSEPSDIPIYLLSLEAARHVKMVLTGEGSDEVLGGYPKHVYERYVSGYQTIPSLIRSGLIEPLIHALPYQFRRAKTAIVNLGLENPEERFPRWFGALTFAEREQLLRDFTNVKDEVDHGIFETAEGNSALRNLLYFDQTSWLPDNLLERGDRMTMAASIEARMPFMDHNLIELASSLPEKYRIHGRQTKWILRQVARQVIPEAIIKRPKVGFRVPVNEWFRTSMRDYLMDHLTGPQSLTADFYHRKALDRILAEHIDGRQNHEKLLWTLLNLEIWHQEYRPTA